MNGGFRERSIFDGGQRGTPTPCHSTFSPDHRTISTFGIISTVASDRGLIFDLRRCKIPNRVDIAIGAFVNLAIGGSEPQQGVTAPPISSKKIC